MRRINKKYARPKRPWNKERIDAELAIMKAYGLKNKRELWGTAAELRKYRRLAREMQAKFDKNKVDAIIKRLADLGLLAPGAQMDDALGMTTESFLDRRLQTVVFRKGLANTIKQARQMIAHGKITINGKKVKFPSYMVSKSEEDQIKALMEIQKGVKNAEGQKQAE